MKKYILTTGAIIALLSAQAQVKVSQGNNSPEYAAIQQPKFASFATDNADYFIIKRTERFEKINRLIIADKNGNISTSKDIRINMGVFNNDAGVNSLQVVGNNVVVFVEGRSKKDGKNTLTARTVDDNGNVSTTDLPVSSIDFVKMSNAGEWFTAVTPDKKHIAVIGHLPHEKNMPDQFKYVLLDENLKEQGKGQCSFAGYTKEIPVFDFLASDKGDLYIISEEFDKSYKYPVIYQAKAGSASGNIIPVIMADPSLRMLSYTTSVNPAGELIVAGYSQQKKTFSAGDVKAEGTFLYNSTRPQEVKTFKFDKPVTNLTARNIVYNGDTFFLVGEQYKAEKEPSRATGMAVLNAHDTYLYTHEDIQVTAFGLDGNKKFDLALSRKWPARSNDQEFMVASGIVNNKLAVIFNDQYGKYIDDKYHRNDYLPVAILINNDGLMDTPVHFEKELDVKLSSYKLAPQFFSSYKNRVVVLNINSSSVKTATFQ